MKEVSQFFRNWWTADETPELEERAIDVLTSKRCYGSTPYSPR
jgi:hypothetical protein